MQSSSVDTKGRSSPAYTLQTHILKGLDSHIPLSHKMGLNFF